MDNPERFYLEIKTNGGHTCIGGSITSDLVRGHWNVSLDDDNKIAVYGYEDKQAAILTAICKRLGYSAVISQYE